MKILVGCETELTISKRPFLFCLRVEFFFFAKFGKIQDWWSVRCERPFMPAKNSTVSSTNSCRNLAIQLRPLTTQSGRRRLFPSSVGPHSRHRFARKSGERLHLTLCWPGYLDKPEILEQFAFFPDNPQRFKFATRELTDDDALEVVERFLEIAGTLQELGDTSEDWPARIKWLNTLIGELWQNRGLYPGMPQVMTTLGLEGAIPFWNGA
ncbi:MAG: hypothetical protein FJZ00_03300, partial [Candidatus Sericytochromatia bacterium]|nr:hypothetical protein [Candidatus Tanganyikabacteria bacterium]